MPRLSDVLSCRCRCFLRRERTADCDPEGSDCSLALPPREIYIVVHPGVHAVMQGHIGSEIANVIACCQDHDSAPRMPSLETWNAVTGSHAMRPPAMIRFCRRRMTATKLAVAPR